MSFSKEQILEASSDLVIADKIKDGSTYQWIDIVGIPQRPSPQHLRSSLYFTTHSGGEEGWDDGFDRRPAAAKVVQDTGWDLMVDQGGWPESINYLQVASLDEMARRLYEVKRLKTKSFVVGVTGSVGKTTTTAFLEHLLQSSGINTVRFYSKRLSPLSVMCHYLNRVDSDTGAIVMEYSAYWREHIRQLAELLPPDVSFLTNIYETHLNPGSFKTKVDIFNSKVKIKSQSGDGYIDQRILDDLRVAIPDGWLPYEVSLPNVRSRYLPPTLRTAELYTAGKILSKQLNLPPEILDKAYANFVPKERRIELTSFRGKDIFFHGETSGGSRLWSWFETTDSSVPWFLVEEINFADEDPRGFIGLLEKVFGSEKTFVLDTPLNRERLPVDAKFVTPSQFREILEVKSQGYLVYHKAMSARQLGFNTAEYLSEKWG